MNQIPLYKLIIFIVGILLGYFAISIAEICNIPSQYAIHIKIVGTIIAIIACILIFI